MKQIKFNKTKFLKSSLYIHDWISYSGIEFAILGYSNVGKSTVLNKLTNQKKLAYVSKLPGRTRLINFFEVFPGFRLVDLPGYGYSRINHYNKIKLNNNLIKFIKYRSFLKGIILISDIRSSLKYFDIYILNIINKRSLSILILLNKSDKISKQKGFLQLINIKKKLKILNISANIILFSSIKNIGILQLETVLSSWWKIHQKK